MLYMSYEKNENEQKEAGFGPFLKYKLKVFSPLVGVLTLDLLSRRFFEKMAIPASLSSFKTNITMPVTPEPLTKKFRNFWSGI